MNKIKIIVGISIAAVFGISLFASLVGCLFLWLPVWLITSFKPKNLW